MKFYYINTAEGVRCQKGPTVPEGAIEVEIYQCTYIDPIIVNDEVVENAPLEVQKQRANEFLDSWNGDLLLVPAYATSVIAPHLMNHLKEVVSHLTKRAYEIALDKTGSWEYLKAQRELYENKMKVAKGLSENAYFISLLQSEAIQEGMDYQDYLLLISNMWDTSYSAHNTFLGMIERGRTKIVTLMELGLFEQAKQALILAESLLDVEDAQSILNQILNLGNNY